MSDLSLALLLHASACFIVWQVATGHLVVALGDASVVAVCAWLVWSWWRRRRQGKPSRVLGFVTNLGHRLKIVNVPA